MQSLSYMFQRICLSPPNSFEEQKACGVTSSEFPELKSTRDRDRRGRDPCPGNLNELQEEMVCSRIGVLEMTGSSSWPPESCWSLPGSLCKGVNSLAGSEAGTSVNPDNRSKEKTQVAT